MCIRDRDKICDIYDESHQNYGAPKITKKLKEEGETISEKTVGNYMREMGLKAQWIKPYTITTIDSNFSEEYKNILDEKFNPNSPDAIWCTDTVSYTHLEYARKFWEVVLHNQDHINIFSRSKRQVCL